MYYAIGVSPPSLHRESTDSLIQVLGGGGGGGGELLLCGLDHSGSVYILSSAHAQIDMYMLDHYTLILALHTVLCV